MTIRTATKVMYKGSILAQKHGQSRQNLFKHDFTMLAVPLVTLAYMYSVAKTAMWHFLIRLKDLISEIRMPSGSCSKLSHLLNVEIHVFASSLRKKF